MTLARVNASRSRRDDSPIPDERYELIEIKRELRE